MKVKFFGLLIAVATLLPASQAAAVTVYTYTGLNYTSIQDQIPDGVSYTTSMNVTAWFTLANPIAPNLPLHEEFMNVLDFSFFDGRFSITPVNALGTTFFRVQTGSQGEILTWDIEGVLLGPLPFYVIQSFNLPANQLVMDRGVYAVCSTGTGCTNPVADEQDFGRNLNSPGTWSQRETPLPAALPLFATGLGVLGLLGWRRKRKGA